MTITLKLQDDEYIFDDWKIESNHWLPSRKLLTLNGLDKSFENDYNLGIKPHINSFFTKKHHFVFYGVLSDQFDSTVIDRFCTYIGFCYPRAGDWYSDSVEEMKLKYDVVCKSTTSLSSFI